MSFLDFHCVTTAKKQTSLMCRHAVCWTLEANAKSGSMYFIIGSEEEGLCIIVSDEILYASFTQCYVNLQA